MRRSFEEVLRPTLRSLGGRVHGIVGRAASLGRGGCAGGIGGERDRLGAASGTRLRPGWFPMPSTTMTISSGISGRRSVSGSSRCWPQGPDFVLRPHREARHCVRCGAARVDFRCARARRRQTVLAKKGPRIWQDRGAGRIVARSHADGGADRQAGTIRQRCSTGAAAVSTRWRTARGLGRARGSRPAPASSSVAVPLRSAPLRRPLARQD